MKRAGTYRKIGMMYDKSNAIAVSAKMALAAMGLVRSRRPGTMLRIVENQMARMGVLVQMLM